MEKQLMLLYILLIAKSLRPSQGESFIFH